MMGPQRSVLRVLALDPYSRGVGFAVFEGPENLIDWGLKSTKSADNKRAVRAIEKLINRLRPDVLVLEDWNANGARRCNRIEALLKRSAARRRDGLTVRLVSRRQLRAIGTLPQVGTKYGRALLIAERFPELLAFLPPVRKPWMNEDDRMSIFDAATFALSFYATGTDDSRDAPSETSLPETNDGSPTA